MNFATVFFIFSLSPLILANPYTNASLEKQKLFKQVRIPFTAKTKFKISQGPFGRTHNEKGNEYQWDFAVPYETAVVAVEAGTVIDVWQPNQGGGCDAKFSSLAHNIKIEHKDKTVSQYVHITALVKIGDKIKGGQTIAKTSKNGFICQPHLHFGIYKSKNDLYNSKTRTTLPLTFKGFGIL